jgi:(1->4)-alpha-D-glucan 1-alpha-D-glucosylmutase
VDGAAAPDANEEYLLYQTLLGSWPLTGAFSDEQRAEYIVRIQDYMTKAIKEAKVNSSWIQPNEPWDEAVRNFIATILTPAKRNRFLESFGRVADQIAELGAINSLAQTVLKLTVPGVPDFYQGNELWDLSLVDPDNRRAVDYGLRREKLGAIRQTASPEELMRDWRDGCIKLFSTHKLLEFRRDNPELFANGTYEPLEGTGEFANCCIAFRREDHGSAMIVIVPRLTNRVGFPPVGAAWRDTSIRIDSPQSGEWRDLFTGREQSIGTHCLLSEAMPELPMAVLVRKGAS